jgi:hypothetical protein
MGTYYEAAKKFIKGHALTVAEASIFASAMTVYRFEFDGEHEMWAAHSKADAVKALVAYYDCSTLADVIRKDFGGEPPEDHYEVDEPTLEELIKYRVHEEGHASGPKEPLLDLVEEATKKGEATMLCASYL